MSTFADGSAQESMNVIPVEEILSDAPNTRFVIELPLWTVGEP